MMKKYPKNHENPRPTLIAAPVHRIFGLRALVEEKP